MSDHEGADAPEPAGPSYFLGGLAGGAAMGIPSAVLGCCCFLWAPLGGVLAGWVAARPAARFGPSEGLLAGLAAGGVGAFISAAIGVPLKLLFARLNPQQPAPQVQLPPDAPAWLAQLAEPDNPITLAAAFVTIGLGLLVMGPLGGLVYGMMARRDGREVGPDDETRWGDEEYDDETRWDR